MSNKDNKEEAQVEMTEEQYNKLMNDLEHFENLFFTSLAESEKFEILPTTTESGKPITKEQIALLKRECDRLGYKALYRIDMINGTLYINPKNMKIGYITEELH
jgi:hypothetical protein